MEALIIGLVAAFVASMMRSGVTSSSSGPTQSNPEGHVSGPGSDSERDLLDSTRLLADEEKDEAAEAMRKALKK